MSNGYITHNMNNRRNFLKNLGLISVGVAVLPLELMGNTITKDTTIIDPHWIIEDGTENIRYVGPLHDDIMESNKITVLDLHRALRTADEEMKLSRDVPSIRVTNNIIELQGGYNIDDHTSEYLHDGSISQYDGKIMYGGMVILGNAEKIDIIQENKYITNDFWNNDNGLNGDGVTHRFLLPVKTNGESPKKLIFRSAEYGGHSEFTINNPYMGNNIIALYNTLKI